MLQRFNHNKNQDPGQQVNTKIILSEQEEKGKYVLNLEGGPAFIAENGPEQDEIASFNGCIALLQQVPQPL